MKVQYARVSVQGINNLKSMYFLKTKSDFTAFKKRWYRLYKISNISEKLYYQISGLWFSEKEIILYPKESYPEYYL